MCIVLESEDLKLKFLTLHRHLFSDVAVVREEKVENELMRV